MKSSVAVVLFNLDLTRTLATLERQVAHSESEKARLSRDIAAARDLAHSLDREKDGTHKHLISISVENERVIKEIEKLNVDLESIKAQNQAEHVKSERLEHLLNSERTKKLYMEKARLTMTNQELQGKPCWPS
jgi:cell division septum initiation protein DivIVA